MAVTIKDIAKETGYAISTVSRALNNKPDVSEDAKKRIQQVVDEWGFVPNANARQLKQHEANAICILVKGRSNQFLSTLMEKMQNLVEKAGYAAILHFMDEEEDEVEVAKQFSLEKKPQAFAFLGGNLENFQKEFRSIHQPSVLVTNPAKALGLANLSSVSVDDVAGAGLAVEYLLQNRHREIGVLGGDIEKSFTSRQRLEGYQQAMDKAGLPFLPDRQYQKCRFSYESAYRNMLLLMGKYPAMTAVCAMSDVMAIGAIRALLDSGRRVPEDISVVGFDGIELAEYYNPRLTTVYQNQKALAARSVDILVECIQNRAVAAHEVLACRIQEGKTVKTWEQSNE